MRARQCVVVEPYKTDLREVELPEPADNQVLLAAEATAVSAGTELAVYTGTHQWLKDPAMPDWKFPFRPGYSAAGRIAALGRQWADLGWKVGDRVSYPGNHASAELLTLGHERGRLWHLPDNLPAAKAALACISRYGLGASVRAGLTLGRSAAVLGLGIIGQFALRCLLAAGAHPVIGIDAVAMRRAAALAAGADAVIDPTAGPVGAQVAEVLRSKHAGGVIAVRKTTGAEIVADATGIPDAVPTAMSLACDAGQVVVVGSPRGQAATVNFYDDLHRRYIEVTGAHGNMLFEPNHTRLAGAWGIDKAQYWLLGQMAAGRLRLDGLVTHTITPDQLGTAYEGLLRKKEEWLGVVMTWA
jgi:2-desacetyl-2-hydroxyethyl bacteriochlorophyllide A dehydrogenase